MATGYQSSFGSDWTRHRTVDNATDLDMATELGTTLSSTAAPAPALQRLSFARHPSVIGSSLGPAPLIEKIVRPANQHTGDGIVFGTLAQSISPARDSSSYDQSPIDVQAVLDGLTAKPLGLTDFKRFLNQIRQGAHQVEQNTWISCAPMLVDFLLEFKHYADRFSRLSLRDQSQCPHPFEILCYLNSQNPHAPTDSLGGDLNHPRKDGSFSQVESAALELSKRIPPDFEASPSHHDTRTPATEPRPPNRKVNWAPSVRSNNHQYGPDWDGSGSTLSATLHEGSILRAARRNSTANSQLSSTVLMDKLKGVDPDHQPLRAAFNTLVRTYLGSSTSGKERNGLLSSCLEICFESIQRAKFEAQYTNHPAVLSGIVAEILVGLNSHVLPVFVTYSIANQKTHTSPRSKTLWGSFLVLIAFIFSLLTMIVPSPLMSPWKINTPIPKPYRLLLFPMIWMGLALVTMHRMKTRCLLCWKNKFRSVESGFPPNHQSTQTDLHAQDKIAKFAESSHTGNLALPAGRHEANRALHQIMTYLITSFVFAAIIQTLFVMLPLLS